MVFLDSVQKPAAKQSVPEICREYQNFQYTYSTMEATTLVLGVPLLMGYVHPSENTDSSILRLPSNQSVTMPQLRNTILYMLDWGSIIFWMTVFTTPGSSGPFSHMTLNCCWQHWLFDELNQPKYETVKVNSLESSSLKTFPDMHDWGRPPSSNSWSYFWGL